LVIFILLNIIHNINFLLLFLKGHPHIFKLNQEESDNCDISKFFGLVTCIVLAPDKLHLPILPLRHNGKLFFPLCFVCMTSGENDYCQHSNSERSFNGTWGTPELELALAHGYKILR